jgi:glycosyltransferase involved in cell wall biosynthesis
MTDGTHVLLISQAPGVSGGERAVLPTLARLSSVRVTVAARDPVCAFARELGLETRTFHVTTTQRLSRAHLVAVGAMRIRRLARRTSADVVYANGGRAIVPCVAARALGGPPLLAHHHGQMGEGSQRAYIGGIRRWADLIVTDSAWSGAHFEPSSKIRVVHNGVDIDRFRPPADRPGAKERLGLQRDTPVVGMLARSHAGKGAGAFIDLVDPLLELAPDARFVLAGGPTFPGEDAMFADTTKRAASYGDRIVVTGYLDDPRPAYEAMDVLVALGAAEGLSLVLLEAWATGVPVVAYDWGAIGAAIDDGSDGFRVPPGDIEAAAAAIARALNGRREAMGAAARARVERDYTITRMAAALEAAIATLRQ